MIEITSPQNKKYIITDSDFEKIRPLVEGLSPFDIEVILEKIAEGKILLTPEKVVWQ